MTNKQNNNIFYNKFIFAVLIIVFAVYNLFIYSKGVSMKEDKLSESAINGQQLWQDHNCTACHQLYGLGGYLGPDLTNLLSDSIKNETYVRSIINAGVRSMPKYTFSETELDALIAFFKAVDKTGYYPNKNANFSTSGWVEIQTKEEKHEDK